MNHQSSRSKMQILLVILTAVLFLTSCSTTKSASSANTTADQFLDAAEKQTLSYETPPSFTAEELFPEFNQESSRFSIVDPVTVSAGQLVIKVTSEHGEFTAYGRTGFERLKREIAAIHALKELQTEKEFIDGAKETLLAPVDFTAAVVEAPSKAVTSTSKGLYDMVALSVTALKSKRSQYEDSDVEAFLLLSKFKRDIASRLETDVYSGNLVFQKELERVAWVASLGNWAPSILTAPISGVGMAAYRTLSYGDSLVDMVNDTQPEALRSYNREQLTALRIPESEITKFVSSQVHSPRHQTFITELLRILDGVAGKGEFIKAAVTAKSEVDAFLYQEMLELLLHYHQKEIRLASLHQFGRLIYALDEDGRQIAAYPADRIYWTKLSESFLQELKAEPNLSSKKGIIIIPGIASDRFKKESSEKGFGLREKFLKQE